MQQIVLKSITDIRKQAAFIFDQIKRKDDVVVVTKNNDKLSVILSPTAYEAMVEENDALWEELEMHRSRAATRHEAVAALEDVINGKV